MRKNLIAIIAFVMALTSACSSLNKDAAVNSFVADLDKLSADIVRTVNENPSTLGVDKAQQLLEARKDELKAGFENLKEVRGFQLSADVKKKLTDSVTKNVTEVNSLQITHAGKSVTDKNFGQKLSKLSADFNSILGV